MVEELNVNPGENLIRSKIDNIIALSRVRGLKVHASLLKDIAVWDAAPEELQDLAIYQVTRTLGSNFTLHSIDVKECNGRAHRIVTYLFEPLRIELNLIPGGSYSMGTHDVENESPKHLVQIGRPFLIGRFPVQQAEWDIIGLNDNRSENGECLPINRVSWDEIELFCDKLKNEIRLPSEAEWEYACRGGSETVFYWGDEIDGSFCWFKNNSEGHLHSVKKHTSRANSFGLVDMIGNVHEWCQDQWLGNYEEGPFDHQPLGDDSPWNRIVRGGSYDSESEFCRCHSRYDFPPRFSDRQIGFRVAADINFI